MSLPDAQFHVFVYGTLRPGGYFYRKLVAGRAVTETRAWVKGALYSLDPGYPGLRPGEARVEGDVLSFDDAELMDQLDELEGYDAEDPEDGEYLRGTVEACDADGRGLGEVSVYWILPQKLDELNGEPIEDWSTDGYTH